MPMESQMELTTPEKPHDEDDTNKRRAKAFNKRNALLQVGLVSLVVVYAVLGGFIFQALEHGNGNSRATPIREALSGAHIGNIESNLNNTLTDMLFSAAMLKIRHKYAKKVWNTTMFMSVLYHDIWHEAVHKILEELHKEIHAAVLNATKQEGPDAGTDGKSSGLKEKSDGSLQHGDKEWSYTAALLFAVSVITTIGYGDLVPVTPAGQVVCVLYAGLGIPLTLLCLKNLGCLLASVYRITWKHVTRCGRGPKRLRPLPRTSEVQVPVVVSLSTLALYIVAGAVLFSRWESWTFLEGCYFCFITLSTIGFGDFVPGNTSHESSHESREKQVVCALYLLVGLALLSMIFQLVQNSVTRVGTRVAAALGLSSAQDYQGM